MRRPSFDLFALALGVYAGTVVLVAVAAATEQNPLTWSPLAAAAVALLVVSGFTATRTNLATRVVENRVHSVLVLVPVIPSLAIGVGASFGIVSPATTTDWLFSILFPLLAGLFVYVVAMRRYVAYLREHERVLAEWTAVPDGRYKWGVRALLLVGAVMFFVGGLAVTFEFGTETSFFAVFAGIFLVRAFTAGRSRQYTLFENGLAVRESGTLSGRFIHAEHLRSVVRSERALTIHRNLPWLFPIRCSITSLDNADAIESTLRERLG